MSFLVRANKIMNNPASELQNPRVRHRLPQGIMSVKEIKKLLNQPDIKKPQGLRDRAMLEVLYATGMRNQELRQLKLNDIDLKEHVVRIVDGKGGKDRILPLGKIACEYLDKYIQEARPIFLKNNNESTLFLSTKKASLRRNTLSRLVSQYAKEAGIKKAVSAHSLRHTCATHMLKNRANLRHIQALLGHKNLNTTQRYTKVEISDLKRAHNKYHPRENQKEDSPFR